MSARAVRAAVVVVLALTGRAAHAGHHCHEISNVVGRERCAGFGGWSARPMIRLDLGVAWLRFDPGHVSTDAYAAHPDGTMTTYHLTSIADRPLVAVGPRFREVVGIGSWYGVGQADLGWIQRGPDVVIADVSARGTEVTSAAGGLVSQVTMLLGRQRFVGPISLGGELGPGLRIAIYDPPGLPQGAKGGGQAWFVVLGQVRADAWLTPHLSLGVQAGVDLVRAGDVTLGLSLGLHLFPYDSIR